MDLLPEQGIEMVAGQLAGPGVSLYQHSVRPAGQPWCRLGILHGYGDHSGRYLHFMRWLAARGVACSAFDFRGHGRAQGRRGHVRKWMEYLDDLRCFLAQPPLREGAGPLFLLGHSHGGLVLAAALLEGIANPAGAVLVSPFLKSAVRVPWYKGLLGRVANSVAPSLRIASGITVDWLSSDPAMQRDSREDPLSLRTATPRWWVCVHAAQDSVMVRADQFRHPLLMLVSDSDRIAHPAAAVRLHALAASGDKQLRVYPGMGHELLRELRREAVFNEILEWLAARAPASAARPA